MGKLVLRRLLVIVPVLFLVSILAFSLVQLVPGDPAVTLAGDSPSPAQVAAIRTALGLDQPLVVQYVHWLGSVLSGDFGRSLASSQPVLDAIAQRLPATLSLILGAFVVAVVLGGLLGIVAGARRGGWPDRVASFFSAISLAAPSYVVGLVLIVVVATELRLLPSAGYVPAARGAGPWFQHLVLPSIALGLVPAAILARQLRGSLAGVLEQDYTRTAIAKGLPGRVVVLKHALKNAAIPGVTALGTQLAVVIGSTVVIEQIFGIQGLGALAYNAALQRDLPVVQGVVLISAIAVQLINLAVDLAYGWLNPKLRKG
ncbi:ABC transporter permease [Amycolatopsis acidicola]|uniref:ABC transporter permease n=1 Tax=Amycolatopsis acidicola TaxID=2596893 RepID=A0A5N0UQB4_9PSEU|nr:ABC transporter permease [Amycolatopsis acidicola]KAA9153449.1 ABC transporter permease [Amycolatopsis acidicola]